MNGKTIIHLKKLIGLELSRQTRAANMQCFHFSKLNKLKLLDKEMSVGEFSVHIQCAWRITNDFEILVGDNDLYEPINENAEYDENFDWDTIGGNLRDIKLQKLLKSTKLIVENIKTDNFGGFDIEFTNNVKLTIFPTLTRKYEYGEFWRTVGYEIRKENMQTETEHFVVGTFGIE